MLVLWGLRVSTSEVRYVSLMLIYPRFFYPKIHFERFLNEIYFYTLLLEFATSNFPLKSIFANFLKANFIFSLALISHTITG